jgi:hypothetical protein
LFFAASVYAPREVKLVGPYGVALGILAGWGLGRWALARNLHRPLAVATLTWGLIAAGEVLAAVQTHRLGLIPERSATKPEQLQRDMLTEGMREYYSHEPEGLSEEEVATWRQARDAFERGEQLHEEAREAARLHRSFYGYLANRIDPKKWGTWSYPWPAVFWIAEVVLGSTAGAWLAARGLRSAAPRTDVASPQPNSNPESQGGRG